MRIYRDYFMISQVALKMTAQTKTVPRVILIDDDESTNYLNKVIIRQTGIVEEVVLFTTGEQALQYLQKESDGKRSLAFVDINMPLMNGWEFIEAFCGLPKEIRKNIVLIILTSSINPDDRKKAEAMDGVAGFITKPLTYEMLDDILARFF